MTVDSPALQKGVKSLILLTIWWLWKTRNDVILKYLNPQSRTPGRFNLRGSKIVDASWCKKLSVAFPCTPDLLVFSPSFVSFFFVFLLLSCSLATLLYHPLSLRLFF
jgi:hypothetical protein